MKFFKQLFCKHKWEWITAFVVEESEFSETGYETMNKYVCTKCLKEDIR